MSKDRTWRRDQIKAASKVVQSQLPALSRAEAHKLSELILAEADKHPDPLLERGMELVRAAGVFLDIVGGAGGDLTSFEARRAYRDLDHAFLGEPRARSYEIRDPANGQVLGAVHGTEAEVVRRLTGQD